MTLILLTVMQDTLVTAWQTMSESTCHMAQESTTTSVISTSQLKRESLHHNI